VQDPQKATAWAMIVIAVCVAIATLAYVGPKFWPSARPSQTMTYR
jgi:hypothetical protein